MIAPRMSTMKMKYEKDRNTKPNGAPVWPGFRILGGVQQMNGDVFP